MMQSQTDEQVLNAEIAEDKALAAAVEARDIAEKVFNSDIGPLRERADKLWAAYLKAQRATIDAKDARGDYREC